MKTCIELINEERNKDYFKKLMFKVDGEYKNKIIYPKYSDLFKAFEICPLKELKVVILGQDPYHDDNQATGLAFEINDNAKFPPSLRNIYKELEDDLGIKNSSKCLKAWARQGVLMFNTIFSVEAHKAGSHKDIGWEELSDNIIRKINNLKQPIVFILWGAYAQKKEKLLTNPNHLIIKSAHPSPLSAYRGFFGSKPFSRVNKFLSANGIKEIDWRI